MVPKLYLLYWHVLRGKAIISWKIKFIKREYVMELTFNSQALKKKKKKRLLIVQSQMVYHNMRAWAWVFRNSTQIHNSKTLSNNFKNNLLWNFATYLNTYLQTQIKAKNHLFIDYKQFFSVCELNILNFT